MDSEAQERINMEKQIEEIHTNITTEMITFIWNEVLAYFAIDHDIRPNVFPKQTLDHIDVVSEVVPCLDECFVVETVRGVVLEAIPYILKCDYLLIFSKHREISEPLKRQLAQMNQHSALWYLFKKMFIGCSTLGSKCFLNPDYFSDGTFVDDLQFCLGTRRKEPPNAYSKACMSHGNFAEPIARALYEEKCYRRVSERGIIVNTEVSTSIGFSPDGIQYDNVGHSGDITKGSIEWIIEIKSPSSKPYACIPNYYVGQCQAGMAITGAKYCDFISLYYKPVDKKDFDPNYVSHTSYNLQDDECIFMIQRIFFSEKYWQYVKRCVEYFVDCLVEKYVPTMEEAKAFVGQVPWFKSEHILRSQVQTIPSNIMDSISFIVD